MNPKEKLLNLLELYENTIDEQHCEHVLNTFKRAVSFEKPDCIPLRVAYPENRLRHTQLKKFIMIWLK